MKNFSRTLLLISALMLAGNSFADNDADELKIAAIEALISAPDEKALPILKKVLAADHSIDVKESTLFLLSQMESPEAQAILVDIAGTKGGLQEEAIRMVGIGGDETALANLRNVYDNGDSNAREAVLEALMIAGDKSSVFEIAKAADGRDLEEAIEMLAVMDAREELKQIRTLRGPSEALVEAYMISGDVASLRELALDASDADIQEEAIESLGMVGGDEVDELLLEIYKNANNDQIREAALEGMLMAGNDSAVIELFKASTDPSEKKELLELLVMMDSDEVLDIIDSALSGAE